MNDLHLQTLSAAAEIDRSRTLFYAKRVALAILLLLLLAGGSRLLINLRSANALESFTHANLQRTVLITHAKPGELVHVVSLPTTLRGNTESSIYARSNGYLRTWRKGIGDSVNKGELLATIDAPEQEQELAQAKAARQQTEARLNLAHQTMERWQSLREHDGVSPQDLEEKRSAVLQAQADLAAADANVKRLEQLDGFRHIVAPFAGVVTRRGVEVGDLIVAGGKELFALAQTDPLRLTIWVPQVYADDVKIGEQAEVSLNELQHGNLKASIDRIAGGIDPQTRARQVDLVLPNPSAKLLPGAYAEVSIALSSGVKAMVAPTSTLMIADQGFHIAVVDNDKRIAFRSIKVGRDLGREVEVLAGISPNDTLVVSPSDQLTEGESVKTLPWQSKANVSGSSAKRN
jgi:RND family efflux transporter MFP subunit